ncbi:MAG: sigma-54 dependent transcriptional regulator [Polyangiaceae bacterium]
MVILETAVALVKEGATDYLQKPWDDTKLISVVRSHLDQMTAALNPSTNTGGLVFVSEVMRSLMAMATQVAASDVPVLITGPNGSGKERLAEIVQSSSARKDKPFIKVNAGALPEQLMEAELFGAEAGAFTGATKARIGRFEAAHGGTLFLDEIGNLSLSGQAKLLRVLQTGDFQRLGSNTTRKVDTRLISATNADLLDGIRQKTFREDLYFRLNVIELRLPPLRERIDDVLPLAEHFLSTMSRETGGTLRSIEPSAVDAMRAHAWPGNVRELENRIRRALLVGVGPSISTEDLGLDVVSKPLSAAPKAERVEPERVLDRTTLEQVLASVGGNISRAAAELGLTRQSLYRKMDRFGLSRGQPSDRSETGPGSAGSSAGGRDVVRGDTSDKDK